MSSSDRHALVQISENFFRKLFIQRHLIWNLVVRDLKNRYIGSFMGFFWSVIHPIVLLVAYTFVFSFVFKIRPTSAMTDNFAIFLFCGLLPWLYFQEAVTRACGSIVENGNLIRKTVFPSEILPITMILSNLVTHLIGVTILVVVLAAMGLLSWTVVFVPLYTFLLVVLCLGLGWLLAALQVFMRDTLQILTVAMVFWFWFTPIFYSVEMVPESLRFYIRLNPLTYIAEGYRNSLLEHKVPEVGHLAAILLFSVVVFCAGGWLFRVTKREFVDVL